MPAGETRFQQQHLPGFVLTLEGVGGGQATNPKPYLAHLVQGTVSMRTFLSAAVILSMSLCLSSQHMLRKSGDNATFESGLQRPDYVLRLRERLWMLNDADGIAWAAEHGARWKKKEMTPDYDAVMKFIDARAIMLYTYVWDWFDQDQHAQFVSNLCK